VARGLRAFGAFGGPALLSGDIYRCMAIQRGMGDGVQEGLGPALHPPRIRVAAWHYGERSGQYRSERAAD